jgi:hypothetical protein
MPPKHVKSASASIKNLNYVQLKSIIESNQTAMILCAFVMRPLYNIT